MSEATDRKVGITTVTFKSQIYNTRKCPLRGHILAPLALRALEVPGVNPESRPQESGGDSKAI